MLLKGEGVDIEAKKIYRVVVELNCLDGEKEYTGNQCLYKGTSYKDALVAYQYAKNSFKDGMLVSYIS